MNENEFTGIVYNNYNGCCSQVMDIENIKDDYKYEQSFDYFLKQFNGKKVKVTVEVLDD
jgi:hypothetical protein